MKPTLGLILAAAILADCQGDFRVPFQLPHRRQEAPSKARQRTS